MNSVAQKYCKIAEPAAKNNANKISKITWRSAVIKK